MTINSDRRLIEVKLNKQTPVRTTKDTRQKALYVIIALFFIILWII